MTMNHSQNLDAKKRWNETMEELKNDTSQVVGENSNKVMVSELNEAVEKGDTDNFVNVVENVCRQKKLPLSHIFDQKVTWSGDSLLHVAADKGKQEIVELICDHFPEVLVGRNKRGDTALHVAVRSRNTTIVKLILEKDKKLTKEQNESGDTPLHEAVYSGDVDVVNEILDVDQHTLHYLNKSKQSPLYLAVLSGNEQIFTRLLEISSFHEDHRLPQCLGISPLHAAIQKQNLVLIIQILKKETGVVSLKDEDGGTPLHYAAYNGYVPGFRILYKKLFSDQIVLERDNKGHLPIHLACKRGHVEIVKIVLQHEQNNINPFVLLNQKGQNILHVAAKNGRSDVVKCLLKNRKIDQSNINQKDYDGNTPLHLASKNLFPRVMFLITQNKSTNVTLLNNKGLTVGDMIENHHMTTRKFLAYQVLREAGVPFKVEYMLPSQHKRSPKSKFNFKSHLNTYLVVATLIVTVTFGAAFTTPGGVYPADDPNPKNRGSAIFAHKPFFWVYIIFNTIAMYNSVIASGLLVLTTMLDQTLTLYTNWTAMNCLIIAFITVPLVFMAAVRLVVDNNSALAMVVTVIGVIYSSNIFLCLVYGFFPFGIGFRPLRKFGKIVLDILSTIIVYNEKPIDSVSHEIDKDEDKKKNNDDKPKEKDKNN